MLTAIALAILWTRLPSLSPISTEAVIKLLVESGLILNQESVQTAIFLINLAASVILCLLILMICKKLATRKN